MREIFAKFFDDTNAGEAAGVASRLINRFALTPKEYQFELDAKDEDLMIGDIVNLDTVYDQSADGSNQAEQMQIVEFKEIDPGHRYQYKAITSRFLGRYGYISDGSPQLLDYGSESGANQTAYGFISDASGLMSDNEPAYRII